MKTNSKSFLSHGNLTRGEFGDIPYLYPVEYDWVNDKWVRADVDIFEATSNPDAYTWAAFDSDYGWLGPWPSDDVTEETELW